MNTSLNHSEEEIRKILRDYFQNDYDVVEFCYVNEITEDQLHHWIQKYPDERPEQTTGFLELLKSEERKNSVRSKKSQVIEPALFARITSEGIEIYKETSANFLKSLR